MSDGPKHPYREALEAAEAFKALWPESCYSQWEFAGSLRRHRSEVGDIDHVVIANFGCVSMDGNLFAVPERVNLLWHHADALLRGHQIEKDLRGGAGPCWGEKHRSIRHGRWNCVGDDMGTHWRIEGDKVFYVQDGVERESKLNAKALIDSGEWFRCDESGKRIEGTK